MLETILIILGSILGLYILIAILDIIFVLSFKSILNKHNKSLGVILMSKLDNIRLLFDIMIRLGVEVDEKFLLIFKEIRIEDLLSQDTPECASIRSKLSMLRDEAMFIASKNSFLEKHDEFRIAKRNVLESDNVYRINIAMYNADVLGYNYWIGFLPTRYIYKILKVKRKEII